MVPNFPPNDKQFRLFSSLLLVLALLWCSWDWTIYVLVTDFFVLVLQVDKVTTEIRSTKNKLFFPLFVKVTCVYLLIFLWWVWDWIFFPHNVKVLGF